jgi:hypothetical protein
MGFRFQKRISILPGVRLNLSKSGASWSIGPRGASVNLGGRGVYGTVGIPGSGLSWRERLDKPEQANRAARPAPSGPAMPERVIAQLVGDRIELLGPDGQPLHPDLGPQARRMMKDEIKSFLETHEADRNQALEALRHLHHDIPRDVRASVASSTGKPDREQYFDQQSYMQALMRWRAEQANAGPDEDAIGNALLKTLGALEWPAETNIAISLADSRLLLDVDLPELEDMPNTLWRAVPSRLALDEKPMSQKERAGFYLDHVCSILFRLLGHAFATSDAIRAVAISAYTQRSNATGRTDDEYVATVELDRTAWNKLDLSQLGRIDPHQLLRRFGARLETNARGILLVQQPLI